LLTPATGDAARYRYPGPVRVIRPARLGAAAVAVAFAALLLTGCIGDGYSYFRHTAGSSLTYFKLPTSWRTYSQSEILKAQGQQQSSFPGTSWSIAFNGSPRASVSGVFSDHNPYPTGEVRVRQLVPQEQDSYSMSSLRAELLGTDPLSASTSTTPTKSSYNVLSYSLLQEANGFHGMHMVVDLVQPGAPTFRLNQVSLLDAYSDEVYVLGIGCNTTCYQKNSGVISAIVSSWAVKDQ
jgi:hypothetical protein